MRVIESFVKALKHLVSTTKAFTTSKELRKFIFEVLRLVVTYLIISYVDPDLWDMFLKTWSILG